MDIILEMINRNIISYFDGYWFLQSVVDLDLNKDIQGIVTYNLNTSFRRHILDSIDRYASLVGDGDPNYTRIYYAVNNTLDMYLNGITDAFEDFVLVMREFIRMYDDLMILIQQQSA